MQISPAGALWKSQAALCSLRWLPGAGVGWLPLLRLTSGVLVRARQPRFAPRPIQPMRPTMKTAQVVGVGVDLLQLSRLQTLLHRQSIRLAAGSPNSYPEFLIPGTLHPDPPFTVASAAKLAHRICSPHELKMFEELLYGGRLRPDGSPQMTARPPKPHDRVVSPLVLRWLALRWTAKEAAFKALQPFVPLRWHDLQVTKYAADSAPGKVARLQLSSPPDAQGQFAGAGKLPWALQDRALGKRLKRTQQAATPGWPDVSSQDSAQRLHHGSTAHFSAHDRPRPESKSKSGSSHGPQCERGTEQQVIDWIAQREKSNDAALPLEAHAVDEGYRAVQRSKPFLEFTPIFHRRWREARALARRSAQAGLHTTNPPKDTVIGPETNTNTSANTKTETSTGPSLDQSKNHPGVSATEEHLQSVTDDLAADLTGDLSKSQQHTQRIDLHLSITHDAGLVLAQVTAQLTSLDAPRPWDADWVRHVRF